jgi:hypothetical protein
MGVSQNEKYSKILLKWIIWWYPPKHLQIMIKALLMKIGYIVVRVGP